MGVKVDCARNNWIAEKLPQMYEWITNATADCDEDYSVMDIVFSAVTDEGIVAYPLENKTVLGGWQLKYDGEWNKYFTSDIYRKLKGIDIASGTPVYFVNATDVHGDFANGKWQKLLDAKACLCYFAPDGLLLFSPKVLKDAFIGFADYYVRHTTEYACQGKRKWEKKAVLDLSKGTYVPCDPPIELFEK